MTTTAEHRAGRLALVGQEVARGERGPAPQTITFLSGDVHNSYLAEVTDPLRLGAQSRVVQAVCSPIRNPMPRGVRMVVSLFAKSLVRPMRFIARTSPDVPSPAYPWTVTDGPWFDNNVALITVGENDLALDWVTGVVEDDDAYPRLQQVYAVRLDPLAATVRVGSGAVQG